MVRNIQTNLEIFRFPLEGKVNASVAEELREAILPLIDCFQEIEIDLSAVSAMDVVGLLLLADAKLEAAAQNRKLRFTGHSKPVVETMKLYGMSSFLDASILLWHSPKVIEERRKTISQSKGTLR